MNHDGLISGTPQLGGSYQVWLAVKNQCPGDSSERLFTFYVVGLEPLFVVVRGSVRPFQWSLASGKLPRGVRFVAGEFRARPQVAGAFRVAITVTDHGRAQSTKTFVLVIRH